jgi:hypothetical protein
LAALLSVQGAPQARQQVPTPNPDPLAGLAPLPGNLPPGLSTLNLTQLAPLLPLLANINATVVASWVPVLEAVNGSQLEAWAPVLNYLSNATVEAVLAALPTINVTKVLEIVPAVNALNASMLEGYIRVLGQVSSQKWNLEWETSICGSSDAYAAAKPQQSYGYVLNDAMAQMRDSMMMSKDYGADSSSRAWQQLQAAE